MRPVAVYSALRLGLFLAALVVLRVIGVGGWLSLILALVVSMLLSFVVLRRQRDAVTLALMDRGAKDTPPAQQPREEPRPARAPRARRRWFSDRVAEDAAVEDAAVDEALRARRDTDPAGGDRG
jgi:hypothetical protein